MNFYNSLKYDIIEIVKTDCKYYIILNKNQKVNCSLLFYLDLNMLLYNAYD